MGILVGVCILYLLIVAFIPGFPEPRQPLQSTQAVVEKPPSFRKDIRFQVNETSVSAWLYLPENQNAPVPCIVMAHGFGGTKDMGLDNYAIRFQEAGFAVLVFDYRHMGESEGEPRQLIWVPYQLEDWSAAVRFARGLKEVDPSNIALWGTSFSGGHVIVTAAKDDRIKCVSAQCPLLDGRAAAEMMLKRTGPGYGLRILAHGQRDMVRSWFGLSSHKIPIVGTPGSMACMTTPDSLLAFARLAQNPFVNEVCARIVLRSGNYRPVNFAKDVSCPVLLQICDKDSLLPVSAAKETEKQLGKHAEVIHYPIGHFDIYVGDDFEKSVHDQLAFFKKHLL